MTSWRLPAPSTALASGSPAVASSTRCPHLFFAACITVPLKERTLVEKYRRTQCVDHHVQLSGSSVGEVSS